MSPRIALLAGLALVVALIYADHRRRPSVSPGLWIALLWYLVLASRPISAWLAGEVVEAGAAESELDGSPLDRLFYQVLILAGLVVLFRRRMRWDVFAAQNVLLLLYVVYCGLSTLWSDYSLVAAKRWIKELGNVVMVLVVLTEKEPVAAMRALLVRSAYILLPMSIVMIRYFPDLGRAYNRWTGEVSYTGVTANKNMLGMVLVISATSMLWALTGLARERPTRARNFEAAVLCGLLALTGWVVLLAHSATAVVCTTVGVAIVLVLSREGNRRNIGSWLAAGAATAGMLFVVSGLLSGMGSEGGLMDVMLRMLGRDPTFTGRAQIWDAVLKEDINPFFGVGFYSFWLGGRAERLSKGYYYVLNEAHNGYVEIYLNLGVVGLALLLLALVAAILRCIRSLRLGHDRNVNTLLIAFLVIGTLYSLSEAVVSRLDVVWFAMLLAMIVYEPYRFHAATRVPVPPPRHALDRPGRAARGGVPSHPRA